MQLVLRAADAPRCENQSVCQYFRPVTFEDSPIDRLRLLPGRARDTAGSGQCWNPLRLQEAHAVAVVRAIRLSRIPRPGLVLLQASFRFAHREDRPSGAP